MNDLLFCLSRLGLSFSLCWLALAVFEAAVAMEPEEVR